MRAIEIIVGLVVAVIAFLALKLMGLLIYIALIAAVVGFIVGLLVMRAFRSRGS